jgi:hypothetical protein
MIGLCGAEQANDASRSAGMTLAREQLDGAKHFRQRQVAEGVLGQRNRPCERLSICHPIFPSATCSCHIAGELTSATVELIEVRPRHRC